MKFWVTETEKIRKKSLSLGRQAILGFRGWLVEFSQRQEQQVDKPANAETWALRRPGSNRFYLRNQRRVNGNVFRMAGAKRRVTARSRLRKTFVFNPLVRMMGLQCSF